MKKKAIILGAGPVGLISGWLLSSKGWDVKLFEAKSLVGGMCRSWKWDDFIVDTGPHIFHTPDKKLWNFWKKNLVVFSIAGSTGRRILTMRISLNYMIIHFLLKV